MVIIAVWRRITTWRFWFYSAISLISLAILLVGAVQTEQMLFRRRVERMVGGIRNMQSENATPEQKQQFVRQWSGSANTDGDCAQKCWQKIEFNNFATRHRELLFDHPSLLRLYMLAGGHLAMVIFDFELRAGIPQYAGLKLALYVAPADRAEDDFGGMGYSLMGDIYFTHAHPEKWPDRISPLHPAYRISRPGGCEGCMDLSVAFLHGASQSDIDRLAQFDYSCLTRWRRTCRTPSDLMPAAWQQKLQDDQYEAEQYKNMQR
ncbi:MAG TPA: hypothetical protein VFK06_04910 [Candidatus Angelobacter sp.]|nr:hypothetical protein [Candidatus Angelobacter sp.]